MTYLEKIFGDENYLLSTEVPSNSRFLVVRELEAKILKELLPALILIQANTTKNSLRRLILVLSTVKKSQYWNLIYDFGRDVAAGKIENAENITLEQYLSSRTIEKAFSLKDISSVVNSILKDISERIVQGFQVTTDLFAKNLKAKILEVSQNLFIGGMVDSLKGDNSAEDTYVIRIVYPGACKYCVQTFLEGDGTPKVFKLSDLIANGEDIYRKPSQYVPVIYQLHPNCRCGILKVDSSLSKEKLFDILLEAQTNYTEAVKLSEQGS